MAKKTTKKAAAKDLDNCIFYTNSLGIFRLVNGKLYNKKDEKVSSKDVSKKGDMLRQCDKAGKLKVEPLVKIISKK